ncbi:MAG: sugar transferase [Chloroflexi bacterium]|nr:sugar transferase [Chloroflexota bacterium]
MRERGPNYIVGLLAADAALTLLALNLASLGRLYLPYGVHLTDYYVVLPWGVYAMAGLVWLAVSTLLSVYTPRRPYTRLGDAWAVAGAVLLSNLAFAGLLYLSYRNVPRLLFVYSLILQLAFLVGLRLIFYAWGKLRQGERVGIRVLIVGAGKVGQELAQRIRAEGDGLIVAGYLDDDPAKQGEVYEDAVVLGPTGRATDIVRAQQIEEVIFALPLRAHQSLDKLVRALQTMPVRVRVVPDFFDLAFFRATIEDYAGIPLIGLRDPAIDGTERVIKRLFDLMVGTLTLITVAPAMLIVALAIRLDSPGPALFRQQRVGENGKLFTIYKFRSMYVDVETRQAEVPPADPDQQIVYKRPDDPRVTRVGYFIRRTSLDELPQLFNVLMGDMSLVGPRPEVPWLVARYEDWQRKRFAVPPGITGWWQVNGRSDRPMQLHTDDDLYYIQNYSPLLDLVILWRTIGAVLRGRGAY